MIANRDVPVNFCQAETLLSAIKLSFWALEGEENIVCTIG